MYTVHSRALALARREAYWTRWVCLGLALALIAVPFLRRPVQPCNAPAPTNVMQLDPTTIRAAGSDAVWL